MGTSFASPHRPAVSLGVVPDLGEVTAEVASKYRRQVSQVSRRAGGYLAAYQATSVGTSSWRWTDRSRRIGRFALVVLGCCLATAALGGGLVVAWSTPASPTEGAIVASGQSKSMVAATSAVIDSPERTLGSIAVTSGQTDAIPGEEMLASAGLPLSDSGDWVVVKEGDTLWELASRVNPGADPRESLVEMRALNGSDMSQPVAGQRIRVPRG